MWRRRCGAEIFGPARRAIGAVEHRLQRRSRCKVSTRRICSASRGPRTWTGTRRGRDASTDGSRRPHAL
eukprot:719049-Pyramimonas_sp.AAC.1